MLMDKTIRRVTDPIELRYWQSRSVGERLVAVCELSEAAYSLKADFRGAAGHDDEGSERSSSHLQRKRG
jgi:hypothetical protein